MADKNWWFNRVGEVAPVSNPGSATPNYGVTVDTGLAPYDSPDEFDALADALTAMAETASAITPNAPYFVSGSKDESVWDHVKSAAGWTANQAMGVGGAVQAGDAWLNQYLPDWAQDTAANEAVDKLDKEHPELGGWERLQVLGGEELAQESDALHKEAGAKQLFWGLDKANEYASTAMVAATLSEDDASLFVKPHTWGAANDLTKERHLNAGEAFTQMFYQKELILDEDRFEQVRQHNTVFNVGALAFNVTAAWKADPAVLFGKGLGTSRDLATGRLAEGGRTAQVQREVLSAPDLETAKATAGEYTGLADKLRATHAVSLYDRSQQLRGVAQQVAAKNYAFEDFKNFPAFKQSASGSTMAKLFVDVADDDEAWNLVFRSALGDPDAVPALIARQGEVSDKIAAIEMKSLPALEDDLTRVETRYQKRLAEQGRPLDARIEITKFGDRWLDDEVTDLRAQSETLNAHLATYESHESWLQRALPGLDEDSGLIDRNAPNSIFNNLDRLGGAGFARRTLRANGGDVKMWRHDDYSPTSWVVRAPTKPFLKRVGVVSLNDVDEGTEALTGYLNQLDYLQGGSNQGLRDSLLSRFTGATTDMERKAAAESAEREGIKALGAKWELSPQMMDRLGSVLQGKRKQVWGKLSDNTMYSPIPGREGPGYVDIDGAKVKMPVDPTQLANFHPMTNLTDLDRTIRQNLDSLRDIDADLVSATRSGLAKSERYTTELVDTFGSYFNGLWKPLALISVRWPMRVVADESMRVMFLAGVLPHLQQWGQGVGNALHNAGVVRPYEWWGGRKVKTGSFSEDSLRALDKDIDPYDYRVAVNPQAAVPADALDFGKIDTKRYDRLNSALGEREQFLRSQEADRFRATTAPTEAPHWARQWDERVANAEGSDARGFFFDPVTHRASSKGFAVSIYPGRMKTFGAKPTARELNYWSQKNSDLLAIPNNRVAVWADKDTGRWHLDIVKTTKNREDAALVASRAEAPEFYDIEDGFTRYLSEENFWGHFDSPFVKPTAEPNPTGGVATDQAQLSDEAGIPIGNAARVGGPERKKIGFGTEKWRTRDGRSVEFERVFGPDTKNSNVYFGAVSSKNAMENLYGGHTRGIGRDRASRTAHDYKMFDPDGGQNTPEEWAEAYTDFVNRHVRFSPLWERMANGKSDDEIYNWLMGTAKGRSARKRVGVRGHNPHQWLSDSREIFDHLFPTQRALEAARAGEVNPEQVMDMFPEGTRPSVNGDSMKLAIGGHQTDHLMARTVNKLMEVLGSRPTDALVRHPFAATVYRREMRRYLSSVEGDKITNNVLAAAEASARAKSVREVKRTLYNLADDREGVHMLRFVSPFFQAQLEVLERWGRIAMQKPETLARLGQLFHGSQTMNTSLWHVTDREGNEVNGYSPDNLVTFQVTDTMRGIAKKFLPGDPLKYAGDFTVPVASLNLITQGENPFVPGLGPLVTIPASEFYFKDRPELEDNAIYHWMFPYGVPKGSNVFERTGNALEPAYLRRLQTAEMEDFDDSAFARRASEIGAQQLLEWELGGKVGPRPTEDQAVEAAKNEYRLRAASSFFMPAPVTPRSKYQFFIDQYRSYKEKYGLDADEKFYDEYGPTYFLFAQQSTESTGMGPNTGEKKAYDQYKGLAQRAPMLTGVLTGPFATDEFSDAVYQWQLSTRTSPASSTNLREHLSPAERIADAEESRGWVEYGKLSSAIEAEVRNRVAAGGSAYLTASSNADLGAIKSAKVREIIDRNPAWEDAYNSRSSDLATFLQQSYDVAFDHQLDGRTDIEAMRTYLISRARLQDALRQREDSGQSSSDQFSYDPLGNPVGDNADLALAWQSWVGELTGRNPLFAEIYNRYLESDDLSTYISPEVSNAA